jgi:hypothetical protein
MYASITTEHKTVPARILKYAQEIDMLRISIILSAIVNLAV